MNFRRAKFASILWVVLVLASCVDEQNPQHIFLGEVTLGEQLIGIKRALEGDAITQTEYDQLKASLIAASTLCAVSKDSSDDDDSWLF